MTAMAQDVCQETWQLRPGVHSTSHDGTLTLLLWRRSETLGVVGHGRREALRALAARALPLADLVRLAGEPEADVMAFVETLRAGGWLMTTVRHEGRPLYTVAPLRPQPPMPAEPATIVLSRFAVLHRVDDRITVESPLAWAQVEAHDPEVLAVLGALARPVSIEHPPGALPAEVTARLLRDLSRAGLAVPVPSAEDTELRLRQWSAHELWFHERTRFGHRTYFGAGFGGTFWGRAGFDPLPARREPHPGPVVDLARPDLNILRDNDMTLTAALEQRRSVRVFDDDRPVTAGQLSELLYRCARVRGEFTMDGVELLSQPYPSGGSIYELELYPVVRKVSGIAPGMYHYDGHEHRLRLVREPGPEVGGLLRAAMRSAGAPGPPQVLIVVAARFGRLMWKYEEMPYALILKHVGVLYQSMYLVATAMGLAPCGLGSGDTVTFAEATGLDPLVESSVGEFMLGSRGER
jgi:SagB-type dehydrogenase family enzyme